MKLLHIIGTLNPVYGGPVEALRSLAIALEELGHKTETVTLDEPGSPVIDHFPLPIHYLGPSVGKYRFNVRLVPWLIRNAPNFDAVITIGIWQFQSFATWYASHHSGFPYFIYVKGALDPWFKHLFPLKHLKKWLYWPWAEYRVLRDASAVLFTTEEERLLARKSFWLYKVKEAIVSNGIYNPIGDSCAQRETFFSAFPFLRGRRLMLFLSRIHQKKGCDLLIKAFARLSAHNLNYHLVIAGPDQNNMIPTLKTLAKSLGVSKKITFTGMITGDIKWGAYKSADVFVLPSHSENYGIVVTEALACGLPVLITDKVNIWREVVQAGAGLVETDTLDGTISLLEKWLNISQKEADIMRLRAIACFDANFEIKQAAGRFVQVIEDTLNFS